LGNGVLIVEGSMSAKLARKMLLRSILGDVRGAPSTLRNDEEILLLRRFPGF